MKEKKMKEILLHAFEDKSPVNGDAVVVAAKEEMRREKKAARRTAFSAKYKVIAVAASVIIAVCAVITGGVLFGGSQDTAGKPDVNTNQEDSFATMQEYFDENGIDVCSFGEFLKRGEISSGDDSPQGEVFLSCKEIVDGGKIVAFVEKYSLPKATATVTAVVVDDEKIEEEYCPSFQGTVITVKGTDVVSSYDPSCEKGKAGFVLEGIKFFVEFEGLAENSVINYVSAYIIFAS